MKLLEILRSRPEIQQFVAVERRPFRYETDRSRRKRTGDHRPTVNADDRDVFRIERVKVWRVVVADVHPDDDAVEARDLRHSPR